MPPAKNTRRKLKKLSPPPLLTVASTCAVIAWIQIYASVSVLHVEHRKLNSLDLLKGAPGNLRGGRILNQSRADPPRECRLYLAESTIPNAGLGLFTGVDVARGDRVGSGDIAIPVIDIEFHNAAEHGYDKTMKAILLHEYSWTSESCGMQDEAEHTDVVVPGLGAAINCHLGLINIDEGKPTYDSSALHRSRDPGAGAITNFRDRPSKATKAIPTGAELFANYGQDWFRNRTKELGMVPLGSDYAQADQFMTRQYSIFLRAIEHNITNTMENDLWHLLKGFHANSRRLNALPPSASAARHAIKDGIKGPLLASSIRSKEWLRRNGKCLDNIRPGRSTIPQAGWGAFATRPIPKGTLVAPAPLIHIANGRNTMKMYAKKRYSKDGNKLERESSTIVGHQLLLNYCFGHEESTILLCPYGGAETLINHNGKTPNARIRWAGNFSVGHNADWLNESLAELEERKIAGLQFEFVATTDIKPGDEVFIDYGKSWQDAWDTHVRKWKPPQNPMSNVRALDLNKEYANSPLRTMHEQETDPYPSNVEIVCQYMHRQQKQIGDGKDGNSSTVVKRQYTRSDRSHRLQPCEILDRSIDSTLYEARMLRRNVALWTTDEKNVPNAIPKGETHILTHIPRQAIKFVDKLYSGDNHLLGAFRHEMIIPNDIFPEVWKNLRRQVSL